MSDTRYWNQIDTAQHATERRTSVRDVIDGHRMISRLKVKRLGRKIHRIAPLNFNIEGVEEVRDAIDNAEADAASSEAQTFGAKSWSVLKKELGI